MTGFHVYLPLCVAAVAALSLYGCSHTSVDPKGGALKSHSESIETRAFDALSKYYCEHSGWPRDWSELQAFQLERQADSSLIDSFENPKLESARAIVITLTYDTQAGNRRKVSFIAPPSCQEINDPGVVSIAGGRIRFRLLNGSKLMSAATMKEYWRNPPFPDAAWVGDGDVVVALRFGDVEVFPDELGSFAESIVEAYEASVPSLVWIRKDESREGAPQVLEHEFESDSKRGRILNYVLSTSFDNRLLAITVIGPVDNAQGVERAAASVRSTLIAR